MTRWRWKRVRSGETGRRVGRRERMRRARAWVWYWRRKRARETSRRRGRTSEMGQLREQLQKVVVQDASRVPPRGELQLGAECRLRRRKQAMSRRV